MVPDQMGVPDYDRLPDEADRILRVVLPIEDRHVLEDRLDVSVEISFLRVELCRQPARPFFEGDAG